MLRVLGYSRRQGKTLVLSDEEIVANAKQQERDGVTPLYSWYDYKTGEKATPPGWLVWSMDRGCGVVYKRRTDGAYIIVTGVQGDFVCG